MHRQPTSHTSSRQGLARYFKPNASRQSFAQDIELLVSPADSLPRHKHASLAGISKEDNATLRKHAGQLKEVLWNLGKPSKIRPTVSSRQNIPAV